MAYIAPRSLEESGRLPYYIFISYMACQQSSFAECDTIVVVVVVIFCCSCLPPVEVQSIAINVSVSLSVCPLAYLKTTCLNFTKSSVCVNSGRCSVVH